MSYSYFGWDFRNSSSFISCFYSNELGLDLHLLYMQTLCLWTLWDGLPHTHSRLIPKYNVHFILWPQSFSSRYGKRTTVAMLNKKKALHIGIKRVCWYLCIITPQPSLSHRKLHNSCCQPHNAVVNVSTQGEPHAAGPARSWDKSITSGLTPSGVGSNRSAQIVTRLYFCENGRPYLETFVWVQLYIMAYHRFVYENANCYGLNECNCRIANGIIFLRTCLNLAFVVTLDTKLPTIVFQKT